MLNLVNKEHRAIRKKVRPVTIFGAQWQLTLDEMYLTMLAKSGIGIAANQVGIDRQLAVIQLSETEPRYDLINPRIISRSPSTEKAFEGCLSVPGYMVNKTRHTWVVVEYQTIYGAKKTLYADGLLAKAMQHEVDHLNGRLIDNGLNL